MLRSVDFYGLRAVEFSFGDYTDWSSSWKFSLLIANAITVSVFLLKYLYRFYAMEYLISFSSR